jgi:HK97 family phage prohead protease
VTSSHVRRLQSRVARTAARFVDHAARNGLSVSDLPTATLPWYEIRTEKTTDPGAADEPDQVAAATVLLFDEIGGSFGVDANALVEDLEGLDVETIKVRINSPGGSVFDAVAIYNALNHHDARIVVYVDSLAASAASIVAMAGDEIVMMPGSQLMIHDASMVEDGNAVDHAKTVTFLNRQSANLADIYRRRAGGDAAQWRDLMLAETWMFADEAVEWGLADRVQDPPKRPETDERMTRSHDLAQFRYAGRRHAPAPGYRVAAQRSRAYIDNAEMRFAGAPPTQQSGRRFGTLTRVEVRTADDGGVHVDGHAAVFDTPTQIGPDDIGFQERIAPGAFQRTISQGADVRFLFNHNPDLVLARTKSGTLGLTEDAVGLAVSADLAPTSVGRDLAILLGRGDVSQMSFGFQVLRDRWETSKRDDGSEYDVRTIIEARLFDVSAVTYPAYDETDLAIREATLARELRGQPPLPPNRVLQTVTAKAEPAPPDREQPTEPPENPAERGAPSSSDPAPATPEPQRDEDQSLRPLDLILRHAAGGHSGSPRLLCPACTRLDPAPATPARP